MWPDFGLLLYYVYQFAALTGYTPLCRQCSTKIVQNSSKLFILDCIILLVTHEI